MHAYLIELASLMAIFAFAVISPGADLAMVMRQAMVHGRRQAIITSFGIGAALMMHVSYTVLGLGLIISKSIYLFNLVKWCGVAYLVYIGIKALRSSGGFVQISPEGVAPKTPEKQQSFMRAFSLGFAANALNPKAVFFFLSIFSTVVSVHTPTEIKLGYGMLMAICLISWFVCVSLFMTTPHMQAAFARAGKMIDRVSGLVFITLGLKLATEKAHM
ncbi:threonine/homoserine/homoserine lactone efflux protein [Paenochrobactrum gallinarii]|uniref:Threonine/homoserine/homoserine lactone efflux protein n=1 Tax=Paenochrobactrum gallinarii TaxID=643673 RepID=A0A841LRX8_9HYPH|nr:LysE family translocator [Paenochrobactrum gallinarii]MBB6260843.1 threonine/homoserine/homoserine lactone efflux protein [Paenochrobactrum gallinarii]